MHFLEFVVSVIWSMWKPRVTGLSIAGLLLVTLVKQSRRLFINFSPGPD